MNRFYLDVKTGPYTEKEKSDVYWESLCRNTVRNPGEDLFTPSHFGLLSLLRHCSNLGDSKHFVSVPECKLDGELLQETAK